MSIAEKYKITEAINSHSSGKFGRLFKGVDKKTGNVVVIKTLVKNEDDPTAADRLRNESMFHFSHDGLPSVLDYYESETECILVRNYIEGETIDVTWNKLRKRERRAFVLHVLKELAELFQILEENAIVHCDIRPGNILIANKDRQVHLVDFGLALNTKNPERRKLLFPLGYAAPELILNQLDLVCQRSDQFSLGIVIWRLYTGQLPLTHPNPSIFTNLQINHPLPDHSALPKGVFPILLKMTAKFKFGLPPNQLKEEEVKHCLQEAIDSRYESLNDVLVDFSKTPKTFLSRDVL